KTMGNVAIQLLLCLIEQDNTMDRVLNGPTNEAWIDPWVAYLRKNWGDEFETRTLEIRSIGIERHKVTRVLAGGKDFGPFDHVVCALPVETVAALADATPKFREAGARTLNPLRKLAANHLAVMAGLQIYLKEDVPICHGHQMLLDSPWGLTSISQNQFWLDRHRAALREKRIGGVISVDVSSWDLPGRGNTPSAKMLAAANDHFSIFREVLGQIRSGLGGQGLDAGGNVLGWFLEEEPERILINATGTWELRPPTKCEGIDNLFFAGDYVRTKTDLACMEGACESARNAVNAILIAEGDRDDLCKVFDPFDREPDWLQRFQEADEQRYERGLPWSGVDLSTFLVSAGWALDTLGDLALLDDRRDKSLLKPAHLAAPERLPRDNWDTRGSLPYHGPAKKVQTAALAARPLRDDELENLLRGAPASAGRKDPMFRRWRLHELSVDNTTYLIPFHVYEGDSLVIHGQARNMNALQEFTKDTGFFPVSGHIVGSGDGFGSPGDKFGYAELWVVDYRDTIAGPYKELVLNFVVSTVKNHRPYRWRSPYSSIVPMMDSRNRLFTPLLLVDQSERLKCEPDAVHYGNELFGTNKLAAKLTIERNEKDQVLSFGWKRQSKGGGADMGSGKSPEFDDPVQDVADYIQLAREMGVVEVAKNARQAYNGEEIQGGLITPDMRVTGSQRPVIDIRAAYKFTPKMRVLPSENRDDTITWPKRKGVVVDQARNSLSALLDFIDFRPVIATYDHHLKSVLYLDGWPTPDGPPIP
ncbi:MAG TPA: FAD-dependent oxidoreductase, partial [Polyangia bacterium]|nr:FAD-dependent oxidoreductase [Polyangia bacterium]